MKKVLLLNILLFIGAVQLKAQQGLFKLSYLPGHTYSGVNKTHIKEEIDYIGDTALVNMTKRMGPPRGFEVTRVTHLDNKVTGKDYGPVLFTMMLARELSYSMTSSQGVAGIPHTSNTQEVVYGKYTDGNKITIDSISNLKIDDSFRAIYTNRLSEAQPAINFPQTPLKVGDSFVDNGEINTPGAGLLEKLKTKTTYTLTTIENEKAFFDTKTTVSINTEGRQITMDMQGGGTGKMVYDMSMNYPLQNIFNLVVSYGVTPTQQKNIKLNGKLTISSDQQNIIHID